MTLSLIHISALQALSGRLQSLMDWLTSGEGPVSYTHLDVYKRQDLHLGDAQPAEPTQLVGVDEFGRHARHSRALVPGQVEAVSYTHLDVYKRQVEVGDVFGAVVGPEPGRLGQDLSLIHI